MMHRLIPHPVPYRVPRPFRNPFPRPAWLFLLWVLLLACDFPGGAPARAADDPHELRFDAPRIRQHLDTGFPLDYHALGGLLRLNLSDPNIAIPDDGDRLRLDIALAAATGGAQPVPLGRAFLTSALRYDPGTGGLHLERPRIEDFQSAVPGTTLDPGTRELLSAWLADYTRQEPLYRLDAELQAAQQPLRIESARVERGAIVVRFNQPLGGLPAYLDELEALDGHAADEP